MSSILLYRHIYIMISRYIVSHNFRRSQTKSGLWCHHIHQLSYYVHISTYGSDIGISSYKVLPTIFFLTVIKKCSSIRFSFCGKQILLNCSLLRTNPIHVILNQQSSLENTTTYGRDFWMDDRMGSMLVPRGQ